jgi:hypothetical protein
MKVMWRGRHVRLAPAFLLSLLLGGPVSALRQNPNQPENIGTFDDADLQFVVDEGRRQIDAQRSDFEHVQSRAQSLLAVGLAVLGFSAGGLGWLTRVHGATYAADLLLWIVAFGVVLIGVGLSASVVVVQANFDRIDTTQMTRWTTPVLRSLAEDYAKSVRVGEITVADRVTVFRLATRYISWGAVLTAVVFVITR